MTRPSTRSIWVWSLHRENTHVEAHVLSIFVIMASTSSSLASSLSDSELRDSLKLHGIDIGPITDSTRGLYVAKLTTCAQKCPEKKNKIKKRQQKNGANLSHKEVEKPPSVQSELLLKKYIYLT